MDVVQSVQNYIAAWDKGGEADCRNVLTAPHCNPSDPGAHDLLSTVYHTLISATLLTWSPKHALAPQTLVAFVQSVLEHLPSPSSVKSSNAVVFGEILVDVIWSIDVDVDEIYQDAKLVVTNAEQGKAPQVAEGQDPAAVLSRAAQAKQSAESDKEKLAGIVKQLVTIGILDADICRERLELSIIFHAGLIPDDTAFMKKEIRARTALFYKQNKFNLLREQSEGYSKLTTELTSSLGPANSPASGLPVESASAIEARARPAWERVVGLVGYFDLDPNRALDIILDVFSTHLASHYAFFLSLLSCSPWAPTPTEDHAPMEPSPDMYRGKDLDEVLKLAERSSGRPPRAPPSPGSMGVSQCRVLAQVLGFKFVYYQLPDVAEHTPRNLYLTAALLIREGFITVEDLSPHITPANEEMDAVHKKYLAACNSRIAGAKMSALAMAAPLETTSSYGGPKTRNATPAEAKKPEATKEMPNQRLGLLHALLSVGALRPAISIISKFPWMVDAFPELSDLMIRVLNYSINDIYESAITFKKDTMASFTKAKPRFGSSGLVPAPERKPHITLIAPKPPPTSAVNFVFFFPEWTQYIPVCSTTDDLIDVLEPLMRFIGPQISRDHTFLTRFLRTGRPHITSINITDAETKKSTMIEDKDNPVRKFWTMVVRRYLLPALCLTQGNAVSTVDIWNIVKMFDVHTRWRFYGEWKSLYKTHPELRVREIQVDRESKGVLRRLSVKTVESLSGTVAKLAHSNPYIFFANVVNQVMAYDNLANVIIASLTHVTVMGFDVLLYIVLDALANPHKERVKQDGINTSDWLQSLASFIGLLFRRFNGDLTYLLQYIVHQLQGGQTSEIVVLRELIWKMAGIEPLPSLGDSQIAAMAGGPVLRIEAVASEARGARLDPEVARFRGPQRLGEALISTGLALPLLIQVAQQRQDCVYQAHDIHLKSLASLFDTTHGVFLQYLDLLATPAIVSADDYSTKVLPSLKELNQVYGISAPICMQVYRPVLNSRLLAAALSLQEKEKQAAEEAEKRLKAALTAKREPGAVTSARNDSPAVAETSTPTDGDGKVSESKTSEDVTMEVSASEATPPAPTPPENPWVPELYSLFDDVKAIAPGNAIDVIGPGFYLTFWQLSTYDLTPPTSKYEDESNALRSLSRQEDGLWLSAERSSDRTRRNDAVKHRQRRERYNNFISLLGQEMKEQTASRSFTIKRLAKEKNHWFSHSIKVVALASALIEHCLHPRALLSPMDADFCAQIIKVIHAQGTPNFSTLHTYDKILGEHVSVVLCSCSEYEARNYGRFLLGILTDISRWAEDEQLFMQDNRVKTGGKVTYLPGFMMRYINKPVVAIGDIIQWKDLRAAHRKWHKKLLKCFIDCIETGEFMHVYNAIVVMKELLPVFPSASVHDTAGMQIDAVIEKFLEKEERADLKILGMSYQAGLKRREPHWAMPTKPAKPATPAPATKLTATSVPPEKPRTPALPGASSSSTSQSDARRPNPALATPVPSAPRAHVNGTTPTSADKSNTPQTSIKAAIESIPRPEVVKRIRPDTRSPAPPKVNGGTDTGTKAEPMNVDTPIPIVQPRPSNVPTGPRRDDQAVPRIPPSGPAVNPLPAPPHGNGLPPIPRSLSQQFNDTSRPPTPGQASLSRSLQGKDLTQSPRLNSDLRPSRSEPQAMPPPSAPSQTSTAQELRETAKQSRPEDKPRPSADSRGTPHPPTIPSPSIRRRSPSPLSRPGTRNASAESRASGGRSRAATNEGERGDEKRPERESRHEPRESRRDGHGRGRNARDDREKDKEAERDRDRRDRHGDRERARDREPRERERERDRGERDREGRERERDREPRDSRDRERDRERDRDRGDRHRRDDKERDRDGRKERDGTGRNTTPSSGSTPAGDDRGLPSRPDVPRRREEESLGKRRRPVDDDSDRASKRVSRKDGHHEDRSRRSSDKDGHERARDTDRRRKERDAPESESRGGLSIDTKLADKRIPDGPASARALPPSTPSGPRAMASTDPSRSQKAEPWPASSARTSPTGPAAPSSSSQPQQQEAPAPAGSLRARISEKEAPPPRTLPRAPSGYRGSSENTQGDRGRGDVGSLKDDSRDGGKKRASSERDNGDGAQGGDQGAIPLKRPRINRNRYNMPTAHAFAKKVLPIDADKTRGGRKD